MGAAVSLVLSVFLACGGDRTLVLWRRSYGERPPALDEVDTGSAVHDEQYAALTPGASRAGVEAIVLQPWRDVIGADRRGD